MQLPLSFLQHMEIPPAVAEIPVILMGCCEVQLLLPANRQGFRRWILIYPFDSSA
jgi:hypothetical protein